jgi:hypothetical protein
MADDLLYGKNGPPPAHTEVVGVEYHSLRSDHAARRKKDDDAQDDDDDDDDDILSGDVALSHRSSLSGGTGIEDDDVPLINSRVILSD